jgi:putative spermidine/putrescine transport system substrate-binding protein
MRSSRLRSNAARRFGCAAALAAALFIPLTASAKELVVTSWGGSYAESQQKAYGASFEDRTGARIRWEQYGGGLAEIRAQVGAGDVHWDVVDVFAQDARAGCREGLFERLPDDLFARSGALADLVVARPNDCVGPNIVWSWVTIHREGRFGGAAPRKIADFFDVERFPGRRAIGAFPQANLEMALVADGVDPARVYDLLDTPAGVDRAFRKLSSLGPDVAFWSSGEEPLDLLRDGEVAMSTAYNGRVGAAVLGGETGWRTVWDGQVIEEEWFVVPAGAPNRERAFAFLAHVAEARQQAMQAKWIPYGPMRRSALEIIEAGEPWFHNGRAVLPELPSTRARLNRSIRLDPDWWAENGAAMRERFGQWRRGLGY